MKITLAIESAISGGSISLIRNSSEVANWIGSSDVSRAEDLLADIDTLLSSSNISRDEIDLIAVSAGPGSFTGIRIGLATALGLKSGLGIEMSSESALRAMVFTQTKIEYMTVALPVGRDSTAVQSFQRSNSEVIALDGPYAITEGEFLTRVHNEKNTVFVLHKNICEKIEPSANVINFGANVAYAIGLICSEQTGVVTEPLFISKSF